MLHSAIVRDGQNLPLRWGMWHVQVMCEASAIDADVRFDPKNAFDCPLGQIGHYTMTRPVTFEDPSDGEVLALLPGDVLHLSR